MRAQLKVEKIKELMAAKGMTQVALARESGVSRATLARLLGQQTPWVRLSTATRLANALGLPDRGLDPHVVEWAYLDAVARQHEHLDFTGLGLAVTGSPMPMDVGFAPLNVRERQGDDASGTDCSAPRQEPREVRRRPTTMPMGAALTRSRRVFLLGDPGSGKTTALRHLARAYARRRQQECGFPQEPLVPVYLRLADWAEQLAADSTTDLFAAALTQLGLGDVPNPAETIRWLRGEADGGDSLLLLDGLDEIADAEARSLVVEKIRAFLGDHGSVRVVITSRVVGFEAPALGSDFDAYIVQPLSQDSMRGFVAAWCPFRHGHRANQKCGPCEERTEQLLDGIIGNTRVRALAGNPLTLTILALLHEAGAALPQRRWDLYEKVTEAFLFSWEEKKRQEVRATLDRGLDLESREVLWILESVALEMQRGDLVLAPRWWLLTHVNDFIRRELSVPADRAASQADTLVGSLHKRSGLLVERAPERFSFSHLAFQEYFAARAVLGEGDPIEALRAYFYHPRWQEVARLASSHLDRRRVPTLLRAILDDPDPTGRFIQRGLLTVLACLADGAPLHDTELLRDLEERIVALGGSAWLGTAIDAMQLLSELLGTRLADFATRTARRLISTAERVLADRDVEELCLCAGMSGLLPDSDGFPSADELVWAEGTGLFPAQERTISAAGRKVHLTWAAMPRVFTPQWLRCSIEQLAGDPMGTLRSTCAAALGRFARRKEVSTALLAAFGRDRDPQVRRAIAHALADAASEEEVAAALLNGMKTDAAAEVKAACAWSLRGVARRDRSARDALLSVVRSAMPAELRAAAAGSLASCVRTDQGVRETLFMVLRNTQEDDGVRSSSLHAFEQYLPGDAGILSFVLELLDGPPEMRLTHCAARAIADCALRGRIPWGNVPVEKVERTLISLKHPCPHTLDALRGLVEGREMRKLGIPREARIARALSDLRGQISVAFVFGSSARDEQRADSDIDLMVIGNVTLRDVAPGLRKAEQELGRPVNAIVYSKEEWRERCAKKEPFVMNILRGKMAFAVGDCDELRTVGV